MDNRPPGAKVYFEDTPFDQTEIIKSQPYRYKPSAVLTPKRTNAENKPFIAGGGAAMLQSAGINKGIGAVTGGKPDYDINDRVKHIKYGEGTVTDMEPGPRDYKVTVDFDDAGQKIMYAAFARLVKI